MDDKWPDTVSGFVRLPQTPVLSFSQFKLRICIPWYTVYPISGQTHLGGFWDVFDWNLDWLLTTCSERNYFSCSVNTILYYILYISKRFHTHQHRWQHLPTGMLSLKLLPCLRDPPSSTKASLAMVWVSMEVLPLSGGISKTHLKIQYWGIMITRFTGKSTSFRWFSQ